MTIAIAFHQQHYRNFKHYYLKCVCAYWQDAFPGLPSYQRFIEWLPSTIETIIDAVSAAPGACIRENADQLKNISQIEHSPHRSPVNFLVNVLCGLIAYSHQPKKPSLRLEWALPHST